MVLTDIKTETRSKIIYTTKKKHLVNFSESILFIFKFSKSFRVIVDEHFKSDELKGDINFIGTNRILATVCNDYVLYYNDD